MKGIKCVWVFLFGFFLSGVLFGKGERVITASRVTTAPKIDGKLDDLAWREGVWFTDFSLITDPTELAKVQTRFQVAYDDEFLYIAARMEEPKPGYLKIGEFLRDGGICHDDSIEVMIDPYSDRYEYFHFITNAAGIKYDARRTHGGEFHDVEWDSNWGVKTTIGTNEWTMEMAIPFSELSLNKKSEGPWLFNIARHRVGAKPKELLKKSTEKSTEESTEEYSSFNPMSGHFHIAQKFGRLYMPEAKLKKHFWGIKRPYDYHIESDKGDWILTGKVRVTNEGSPKERFQLLFKQVNKKGAVVLDVLTDEIPMGGEKEFGFCLPVEKQEPLEFQVEVADVENAKEVYRVKKVFLEIDYRPMELQLVRPSYRNSIYPHESITELKMVVRLTLAPKVLRGAKLQIRLLNENADLVAEKEYENLSNVQELPLWIGDIPTGSYMIETQVMESKGEVVAKTSQILKKLKPEEHEWRLDSNGALLHNGEEFLPKGWLGMLPGEMQLANGTYNALFMNDIIVDEQEMKRYLDSVSKAKGYAVVYPYSTQEMNANQNLLRPLTGVEIKAIQQRVRYLRKHPALMAWVIAYNPEFNGVLSSRIKQVYSVVANEDPFHPVVIVNSSIGGIKEYLGLADINMPSMEVTFLKGKDWTRRVDSVSYYLDIANNVAGGNAAVWAGLQAYDYSNIWTEYVRVPTFIELRNMFYQAVIGGVKGFFWNNFPYTYNYPEIRLGVEHLAKELTLLKEAVLAEEEGGKIKVQCEKSNVMFSGKRAVGEDKYLFVVNTGPMAQDVVFETMMFDGVGRIYVLSENRSIEVKDGGIFRDHFEPYATHVYVTKPMDSGIATLEEVQKEVELANKARKKAGNVAFEDSGVKVSMSSSEDLSAVVRLNDGIFEGINWASKKGEELPQWIELSWGKPVKLAKIVIYSDTIENAKIQVEEGGQWADIADFKRRSAGHLRAIFKEKEVNKIRIFISEKKPGVDSVTLSEIEAYNDSTQED